MPTFLHIYKNRLNGKLMKNRFPYDNSAPSPSEELIGIIHGINLESVDHLLALNAIKSWMVKHLSDDELQRLEKRDPLWDFDSETSEEAMKLVVKYGLRVENGQHLTPLPGMNYSPRLKIVK
tara:strand:+ start:92 stop:457 length:366 start_codon:yes stop_codon:yes gene_type:complete